MDDAGVDSEAARAIAEGLGRLEQGEVLRAYGHVEPRKRFVGGPLVVPSDGERRLLFVDESGKSGIAHDEAWAVFGLGAIALTAAEASRYCARADALKDTYFGRHDFTFHEPGIRRGHGPYSFAGDTERRASFERELVGIIETSDITTFGVGVRKGAFRRGFVDTKVDPYLPTDVYSLAIQMLLERYVDYVATTGAGRTLSRVTFESQGPLEDAIHQRDYARVLISGTQWINDGTFRDWLETGVRFTPKQGSDPMELADMFSRDLYEWVRDGCVTAPGRWRTFTPKIHCRGDGQRGKFGVKVFPDSDIRPAIEAHRTERIAAGG
jgi:hypothetical protein